MQIETWLPVPGYEDFYAVSNLGNFQRIAYAIGARRGLILRGGTMGYGENRYRTMTLCRSPQDHKTVHAARIVATAFHGPAPSPTHQVNHKNGIRNDDRAENLEWATPSENTRHRFDVLGQRNPRGEAHHNAVHTEAAIGAIKAARLNGASYGAISEAYGVPLGQVKNIIAGRTWKHVAATESDVRGRKVQPRGEANHATRITADDVRAIRTSTARGVDLAKQYGLTSAAICAIRKRKNWAHVE